MAAADFNRIINTFNKITEAYEIDISNTVLHFNGRLKSSAGRMVTERIPGDGRLIHFKKTVELNPKYFKEFGIERTIKTLKHELAHLIVWEKYKQHGHTETFKRICHEVGGSMNENMATGCYIENISREYIQTPYKWQYDCPCGMVSFKKKRKMGIKTATKYLCSGCRTSVSNMKLTQLR